LQNSIEIILKIGRKLDGSIYSIARGLLYSAVAQFYYNHQYNDDIVGKGDPGRE
jgi:hypothetical protein